MSNLPENPLSRVEQYLASMAGQETPLPEKPLSRVEQYLAAIAEQGGGLPPVTDEDNGKFARVVDGAWAAVKSNELSSTLAWGKETHGLIGTTGVTLPEVEDTTVVNEITYTFTATAAAYSFTAPDGYILGDDDGFAGLSAGNTLAYTDLTVGSVYETSFKVLDATHIALVMKEWKTA